MIPILTAILPWADLGRRGPCRTDFEGGLTWIFTSSDDSPPTPGSSVGPSSVVQESNAWRHWRHNPAERPALFGEVLFMSTPEGNRRYRELYQAAGVSGLEKQGPAEIPIRNWYKSRGAGKDSGGRRSP